MQVTTISLLCPLWAQMADVTALCDERGLVAVLGCSLNEAGAACLAACEAEVRQWCAYAAPSVFQDDRG